MPDHVVQQGECMSSIALLYGFTWKSLWNSGENRDLKQARKDPNVLFPGDVVKIPDKQIKELPRATEARHKFVRYAFQAKFRVRLMRDDQPRADEDYLLEIDGTVSSGTTDSAGWIEKSIPPNAKKGKLTLSNGLEVYELQLGTLDPADQIQGVAKRLMNLGYFAGPVVSAMNDDLRAAIRAYQADKKMDQSGEADAATISALKRDHAS